LDSSRPSSSADSEEKRPAVTNSSCSLTGRSSCNRKKKKKLAFLRRLRKHAGRRPALLSSLFFGLASLLAVLDWFVSISALSSETYIPLYGLSAYAYLASAICSLTGTRSRPWSSSFSLDDADSLDDMGDIFFLVGSIVYVILCNGDDVIWWPVFSSLLWFLDACLYLRSDAVFKAAWGKEKMVFLQEQQRADHGDSYTSIGDDTTE
jgi:hypothetical protein